MNPKFFEKIRRIIKRPSKQLLIFDTNMFMSDPHLLKKYSTHDCFIPTTIIHELDKNKIKPTQRGVNARIASQCLLNFLTIGKRHLKKGIPFSDSINSGRLFFEMPYSPNKKGDDAILESILQRPKSLKRHTPLLMSQDVNLCIKAQIIGIDIKKVKPPKDALPYSTTLLNEPKAHHLKNKNWTMTFDNRKIFLGFSGFETKPWKKGDFLKSPHHAKFLAKIIYVRNEQAIAQVLWPNKSPIWQGLYFIMIQSCRFFYQT